MKVWAFDENRADFVDAAPERMNADATGYYIIRRGDDVLVREHGQERPMPERLTVAGVPFDREQFEHTHPLPLRAEMKRDGQWARARATVSVSPVHSAFPGARVRRRKPAISAMRASLSAGAKPGIAAPPPGVAGTPSRIA